MSHNSYLCDSHSTQAAFFCLCDSSPLFLCPVCLPKHEGHDFYPILQFDLFQGIERNPIELKRRNALSQRCESFLEMAVERETADQAKVKALMETLSQYYSLWLEGNHHCFDILLTAFREETAMLLTRSKYRVSSITQKLLEKLEANPDLEQRLAPVPELETLSTLNDHCQEACSRPSKVFQIDYEEDVLQTLNTPCQPNKRKRSPSVTDSVDAQLQLKLEEAMQELHTVQADFQTQTQHYTSLQEENTTLNMRIQHQSSLVQEYETILDRILTELCTVNQRNSDLETQIQQAKFAFAPPNESEDPVPDYSTPQSKAALAKFGPYSGQDDELQLIQRGLVREEEGVYIGQWNVHNQKHGYGMFLYKKGDMYEGHWRNGQQSGRGRYIHS